MNLVAVPGRASAKAHVISGDAKRIAAAMTHSTTLAQALTTKQTINRMMRDLREMQVHLRGILADARDLERENGKKGAVS
jgi:hypothetical protein